jgi:hypothetical protein
MRLRWIVLSVALLIASWMALVQSETQRPENTNYSAAFIRNDKLVVFPFEGKEVVIELSVALGGMSYSASGQSIYGIVSQPGSAKNLAAVRIKPIGVRFLPGLDSFRYINAVAVNTTEDKAVVSATYERDPALPCGLFNLDLKTGQIEYIIGNIGGGCDYLSSWNHLSLSPDGRRAVGTASKGHLGLTNIKERRIERLWSGTSASWSPNGKWIAATSFENYMQIELIDARSGSKRRGLGTDDTGELQWSPDSRYLLVSKTGLSCGWSMGYAGTLEALDVETGQRLSIASSRCRVNLMTTGWVSDEVFK